MIDIRYSQKYFSLKLNVAVVYAKYTNYDIYQS